ncbi:protein TolR [Kangiella sediminilitoris]|uniref:Tol-Pal system protein TolR n=1 Tax=Kangiella sediminilitoris TaxID=1144748 RepID=A0A1B3BBY7_9GAMM|nr:protein TolR [Kangiella sediminilitoris]AOE50306.1 biopolymer transporter ExbD [Kangiella sediminilitoris]
MPHLVRRERRRLNAEINVVPYIDVMLVLLVIFMITAPLITAGIQVDLPTAAAEPMSPDETTPFIVTIDSHGQHYLEIGSSAEGRPEALSREELLDRVVFELDKTPNAPILINGDKTVPYGDVVELMDQLRQVAGIENVGLMTQQPN